MEGRGVGTRRRSRKRGHTMSTASSDPESTACEPGSSVLPPSKKPGAMKQPRDGSDNSSHDEKHTPPDEPAAQRATVSVSRSVSTANMAGRVFDELGTSQDPVTCSSHSVTGIFTGPVQTSNVAGIVYGGMGNTIIMDSASRDCLVSAEILENEIQEIQKLFVETKSFRRGLSVLQQFGHVTITGAAGEGKTSMALMLGAEYRNQGYQILKVKDEENFKIGILPEFPKLFVIFDDIFGSVGLKTPIRQLEMLFNQLSQLRKLKERDIVFVFTTKSYNLKDGLSQMRKGTSEELFEHNSVLDISKDQSICYTVDERQAIFESHNTCFGSGAVPALDNINMNHFGFPLTCRLYFKLQNPNARSTNFITKPLACLRRELEDILKEKSSRSAALILMLLCEDKLNLARLQLESNDEKFEGDLNKTLKYIGKPDIQRTNISCAVKNMRGAFFTEGDIIGFVHPVVYDACAVALAEQNIAFVLKNCSVKFLYERVRATSADSSEVSDEGNIIYLSSTYYNNFIERLIQGIKEGFHSLVLTHPLLKVSAIAEQFVSCLFPKEEGGDATLSDKSSLLRHVFHWTVVCQNSNLFHEILKHNPCLTDADVHALLIACATSGNVEVFKIVSSMFETQIKEVMLFEAFQLAAENRNHLLFMSLLKCATKPSLTKISPLMVMMTLDSIHPDFISQISENPIPEMLGNEIMSSLLILAVAFGQDRAFQCLWETRQFNGIRKRVDQSGIHLLHLACYSGSEFIVNTLLPAYDINSRDEENWTPLMTAVISGNWSIFHLLSKNANLNLTDSFGNTVLHFACQGGNASIVKLLLEKLNINIKGQHGGTPVMNAAVRGKNEVFDLLVSKEADLTLTDDYDNNLLHLACIGGNKKIVEYLLPLFDINSRGQSNRTPLMMAAVIGNKQIFDLLLSHRADRNLTDMYGHSIHGLAFQGRYRSTEEHSEPFSSVENRSDIDWFSRPILSEWEHSRGSNILSIVNAISIQYKGTNEILKLTGGCLSNVKDIVFSERFFSVLDMYLEKIVKASNIKTLIHELKNMLEEHISKFSERTQADLYCDNIFLNSCFTGNISLVRKLLPVCDINCRWLCGITPVMAAAAGGKFDVFQMLTTNGADISLVDDYDDRVLHFACLGRNEDIIGHLLQSISINCLGCYGQTPLMRVAEIGNETLFNLLQTKGAKLAVTDNHGDTVLHIASEGGHTSIVEHILPSFDINSRGQMGLTSVMTAALSGKEDVFDLLVQKRANLTLTDNNGDNLLHLASRGGNISIMKKLLQLFDIDSKGHKNRTPVMNAASSNQTEVVNLLVEKGADLSLTDEGGDTILHISCRIRNPCIVNNLLPRFNINIQGQNGLSSIMNAAQSNNKEVFDLLLEKGADLNVNDNFGNNLLHKSCQGGSISIVKIILKSFDINSRGQNSWTAAMYAAYSGNEVVFDLLVANQADMSLNDDSGDTVFHKACLGANVAIVEHLIHSFDINQPGASGWTPVMKAAFSGNRQLFDLLVSYGANLTLTDDASDTVFHKSCHGGNVSIVESLLSLFDNINLRGENGRTPLMTASYSGKKEVFFLLLSKGADLRLNDDYSDGVLDFACQGGNTVIVEYLLKSFDIDINNRGQNGWTLAMKAAVTGKKETFDLLVTKGANLKITDDSGDNHLHKACIGGNISIVEHLLPLFDINSRGWKGWTPVMNAAIGGKREVFDLLVSKGANLTLVDNSSDTIAFLACMGGNRPIVEYILSSYDINIREQHGQTLMMKAVQNCTKDMCELLVRKGADLKLTDNYGDNVLHLACHGGNTFIVDYLLQTLDINKPGEEGFTPVMKAAYNGKKELFDLLLTRGADLTLTTNSGENILHLACWGGNSLIVEGLLLSFDINSRGTNGWTPIMKAVCNNKKEIFDLLLKKEANLKLTDNIGDTVLHIACQGENIYFLRNLLLILDINSPGAKGFTPIMKAAHSGMKDVFDLLLEKEADYKLTDTCGDTLLHIACQGGNTAVVERLLLLFDINKRGANDWTPLMRTAYIGNMEVLKLLVTKDADLTMTDKYGDSLLHLACQSGNKSIVEYLLPSFDINRRGGHNRTPLMNAVYKGKKEVVNFLMTKGADLTLVDSHGDSALHLACQGGDISVLKHILSSSFDINSRGQRGLSAIMMAAYNGNKEVFDLLMTKGPVLTMTDNFGDTVLHLACQGGNASILGSLSSFCDINCQGEHGFTPVMRAAFHGNKDIFDFLMTKGADLTLNNNYGDNVLHKACEGGHPAIVDILLRSFDINSRGHNGWTPVMNATYFGRKEIFELLIEKGADLKLTDNFNDNIVYLACQGGHMSIIKQALIVTSFDINSRGTYGWTVVMKAVQNCKKEVIDLLVTDGADLSLTDNYGDTVLHLACRSGNASIVEHLLTDFDINRRGQHDWTPVMIAAYYGKKNIFDLLVKRGADLKLTNNYGNSILHLACEGGNQGIIKRLLLTFNVNIRGMNGYTPAMSSALNGNKQTFDLVSKGANLTLNDNYGDNICHLACQGGNIAIVELILPSFEINVQGQNGWTGLMYAAFHGKKDVFHLLLAKGADVNMTDSSGDTVLQKACLGGEVSIVERLLPLFHINMRGNHGWTPVMNASVRGRKEVVDLLLRNGADPALTSYLGDTALHLACRSGNTSLVELLLPYCHIQGRGEHGFTPIMNAVFGDKNGVFDLLMTKGADVSLHDNSGDTVLHLACQRGNTLIIKCLLPTIDINSRGKNGWTPVMTAAAYAKKEVFELLITNGADLKLTSLSNRTLLHCACSGGNLEIVQHILPLSDINTRANRGITPLATSVYSGHVSIFDLLVSYNADVQVVDDNGDSLLHHACEKSNLDMVKHVFPLSDINSRNKLGLTPTMTAARSGYLKVLQYLLSHKANLSHVSDTGEDVLTLACRGTNLSVIGKLLEQEVFKQRKLLLYLNVNTLLHLACIGGNRGIVEELLPCFDINVRGLHDWTPLMMAAQCGHLELLQYLVSQQADLSLVSDQEEDVFTLVQKGRDKDILTYVLTLPKK